MKMAKPIEEQPFSSTEHPMTAMTAYRSEDPAVEIATDIWMSRSNSNSYLIASDAGDVVINTGTLHQGERHRERFAEAVGRPLNIRYIVLTQSHPDHMGGWSAFNDQTATTIAQSGYSEGRLDRLRLREFFLPRSQQIMGRKIGYEVQRARFYETPEAEVDVFFDDHHGFEVGTRRFELYSVPGGETLDGLLVWLPEERIVFSGNLMGALYGQLPHLTTLRGDRPRSARLFVSSLDRLLSLEPEVMVTGHGGPISGGERIRAEVSRIRDATQYINDEVIAGMNAGKDLWTLMDEIGLPDELTPLARGRGRVAWYVRTVWHEYSSWFLFQSPTELYELPQRAIWPDLAALAGGTTPLLDRAESYLERGEPLQALHLTDIARAADPNSAAVAVIRVRALEELYQRSGGEAFDEVAYLEAEIATEREKARS
jgi:glyoxylase-like metal-dependent hydrolase (beta-lactamase superfamily II)